MFRDIRTPILAEYYVKVWLDFVTLKSKKYAFMYNEFSITA